MSTEGIVPTFDPSTGASGGPAAGGGGADLSNVTYEGPIDLTDAAWTLLDPDSLVKSQSFAGGFNNIVMNALGAGSVNYNWAAGTDHRGPRWYIPLNAKDANGNDVRINSDDTFLLEVVIKKGATTAEWNTGIVCGVCADPTSTVALTIDGAGGQLNYVAAGNSAYGAWTVNAGSTGVSASNVRGISSLLVSGNRIGAVTYINLDSLDARVNDGSRNTNQDFVAATDLFLMVGVGLRSNTDTITDNDDTDFQIHYRAIKLTLP
jgi:hypothetical protein